MATKVLNHPACKELLHFGSLKLFTFLRVYLLNKCMLYSNIYIYVYTKSRIKASRLKERRKKETLLDSHRLSVKDSLLSIRLSGIVFFHS